MQKSQIPRNSHRALIFAVLGCFLMLAFTSCGSGKESKNPTCVKLTKAQIQKWVKKGYTNPTNPDYMTSLRFTTAYADPGAVFKVFVMGVRTNGDSIPETLTELTPVDTDNCKIKLSTYIFSGVNPFDFSELHILKEDGTIIDNLEYLKLVPFDYYEPKSEFNFVAYTPYVIKKGGITSQLLDSAGSIINFLPCPPCLYCKVTSCPTICEGRCGPQKIDSATVK